MNRKSVISRSVSTSAYTVEKRNNLHTALTLALVAVAFLLTACSAPSGNNDERDTTQDSRLTDLERRIAGLEAQHTYQVSQIDNLQLSAEIQHQSIITLNAQITALQQDGSDNSAAISALQTEVAYHTSQINTGYNLISGLQYSVNTALVSIAALELNVRISRVVDVCNDGPGYDEVILDTSVGYVAYFEQGGNRFLSILQEGVPYVTSDGTNCHFSVQNGQLVY